ncbi:MAG: hypothetical protein ACP5T2_06520 [Thermoprotei archaeon]
MTRAESVFGIFLIFVGLFFILVSLTPLAKSSGAVIVLIGPIPVSMGFGPFGLQLLVIALSLALSFMVILTFFALFRKAA